MSDSLKNKNLYFFNILKSAGAVLSGLVTIFVTSLGTDQILHVLNIYPPWGEPMFDNGLNVLALSYRLVYGVLGCYITAFLAPNHPMRHALILGGIGLILSAIGVIGAMKYNLGPMWYPISLVLTGPPSAWLGGRLREKQVKVL
ncbi:hypothetical protein JWG45_13405 [Leptospira sp. 201903070]|uniref:DUF4345 domain-containing protein n=1 Tax=Leptospira ainlahdjerensis TaxID=2810033 RepID=A0ABS2UCS6_9LEPT|nr:hypothetical protein [Leptospira ainlahdjerensis]MBM9578148.1 hypothetical protein [Leptospira ainlahdjerensis]